MTAYQALLEIIQRTSCIGGTYVRILSKLRATKIHPTPHQITLEQQRFTLKTGLFTPHPVALLKVMSSKSDEVQTLPNRETLNFTLKS